MPDNSKKFHEFALQSILFKGRSDWYFCYLKTEKIAHVLVLLGSMSSASRQDEMGELLRKAAALPAEIAHLAAGEVDAQVVLGDLFGVLSAVRLLAAQGVLTTDNGALLVREYEQVAERLVRGSHPSPFVSHEDFQVPALGEALSLLPRPSYSASGVQSIKDTSSYKGQDKRQSERMSLILEFVRKRKSVSIKEIASTIRDCSEKTIQRELGVLIAQGLVKKVGERRWSVYLPT